MGASMAPILLFSSNLSLISCVNNLQKSPETLDGFKDREPDVKKVVEKAKVQKVFPERKSKYFPLEPANDEGNSILEEPTIEEPLHQERYLADQSHANDANLNSLDGYIARANGDLLEAAKSLKQDMVSSLAQLLTHFCLYRSSIQTMRTSYS